MQDGRGTVPAVERWAGAGHSDDSDPARAGAEAVAAAIGGDDPRLVLVFASPRYSFDALLPAARQAAGSAELIGGARAGEGVSAFALGGRGFTAASAAAKLTRAGSREAGEQAARCLRGLGDELPHRALIVVADPPAGDSQEVARGAYSVAGVTVSLIGGSTDAGPEPGPTTQLHGDRMLSGSVVAAALASEAPFGVGVRHGLEPRGGPLLVTATHGTAVETLNDPGPRSRRTSRPSRRPPRWAGTRPRGPDPLADRRFRVGVASVLRRAAPGHARVAHGRRQRSPAGCHRRGLL